jgi:hypothetical protein
MSLDDDLFIPFRKSSRGKEIDLRLNKEHGITILAQAMGLTKEVIELILKKYPSSYDELNKHKLIHFQDGQFQNTPLLWAIANSSVDSALVLLDRNIITDATDMALQINTADLEGKTPLILAIAKGPTHQCDLFGGPPQSLIIEQLLDLSADVTIQNIDGQTALHYAAIHRDIALMKKLILAGGNLTQPDKNGNTPLHMANFTEQQADAFLYSSAVVFTRKDVRWSNAEFRLALDELVGYPTEDYIPSHINLPPYSSTPEPEEKKEYERNLILNFKKEKIENALLLFSEPQITAPSACSLVGRFFTDRPQSENNNDQTSSPVCANPSKKNT